MTVDGPIVDCHTHIFPSWRRQKLIEWVRRSLPEHPIDPRVTVDEAVQMLADSGVERWVNLLFPIREGEADELHEFNAELAAEYPGCVPVGGVHADDPDPLRVVRRGVEELGSVGIKLHPLVQQFSPVDPRLRPALDYLDRRQAIVYVHTGFETWYGLDRQFADVEVLAARYEGLTIVLPHVGYPTVTRAVDLAVAHQNVWLDLTNLPMLVAASATKGIAEMREGVSRQDLLEELRSAVDRVGHRIVHGTDHPGGLGDPQTLLDALMSVGWDDRQLERVLVENPARLLAIATRHLQPVGQD